MDDDNPYKIMLDADEYAFYVFYQREGETLSDTVLRLLIEQGVIVMNDEQMLLP